MATFESPINDPGLDLLSVQNLSDTGLWASLKSNFRARFAPKQPPLRLTSRPLTAKELASPGAFNLVRVQQSNDQGLLARLLDDVWSLLFPPRHASLHLTSKPVKVREIWGEYNLYKKQSAIGTGVVHALLIAALFTVSWAGWKTTRQQVQPQQMQQNVELILPSDITMPVSNKKNDTLQGGGGGGDRDKLPAPKGRLPKFAMQQFTPPAVVIRNSNPKLPMEPTVVMPPQVKLPIQNNLPNLGDPLSKVALSVPSNGTGSGSGIGSGRGGGVGSGEGGGVGPGMGGGFGGGVFRVGGGVSAPKILEAPDPDYSEEARKAKYQGTCILWLIVGPDGRPRDIKLARTLGMGLDEKAVEAVRRWKFEPAMKDGRPVAVQINVEVNFRLY